MSDYQHHLGNLRILTRELENTQGDPSVSAISCRGTSIIHQLGALMEPEVFKTPLNAVLKSI